MILHGTLMTDHHKRDPNRATFSINKILDRESNDSKRLIKIKEQRGTYDEIKSIGEQLI